MRFTAFGALWLAALTACTGMSSHSAYGAGDPALAAANPGGGTIVPFLTSGDAVLQALDAIAGRAGKPLRVTSISADRMNGLMVNVQQPAHHQNVDRYVVTADGALNGPTPVKLMSLDGGPITAEKVDARAFDPKSVGFVNLTRTARQAIAKSGYPDARVTEWDIEGIAPDDRRFIYLESARARPSAEVNVQLTIVRMSY
ncbi:MAG: hypothetical protein JO146_01865 [Candidatus Eremiobacteraeota bacterium]|nr:hypothetical protein [Candidatus Eremiobacteraeota bacterium]